MIEPCERASLIVSGNSANAEPLIDLLLWASQDSRIRKTAEFDALIELLYAKTEDSAKHREAFTEGRMADDGTISQTHQVV